MTAPLEDVPLVTYPLSICGRTWRISAAADHDVLLEASERFSAFPFGLLLWESAVALGIALASEAGAVEGKRVLELGAGVGLAGLVARSLGGHVRQTDHAKEALTVAIANATANGVSGIEVFQADWRSWHHSAQYDLIIGADILYELGLHEALLAIFRVNLAPGGRILIADPKRTDTPKFIALLKADGWQVAIHEIAIESLGRADTPSGMVPVQIISAGLPQ